MSRAATPPPRISSRLDPVWGGTTELPSRDFVCGHCGRHVTSQRGYETAGRVGEIYICHACNRPSFFTVGIQVPGNPGAPVLSCLPEGVSEIWEEIRQAMAVGSSTLAVMGCRKLLMNIAVRKGAQEKESFEHYVDWLDEKGWVPPGSKAQLTRIRRLGNTATHQIEVRTSDEARAAMRFLELLLRFMFEFADKEEPADSP